MEPIIILAVVLFLVIATLYASVGHAGASGYLAAMALLSFAPESIKPISLVLNICVATIVSYKYIKAGYFDRKIFIPVAIASLPMAFIGGSITVDPQYFKLFAGIFLIISATLLLLRQYIKPNTEVTPMPFGYGLMMGAMIGLISGLIGVGGGIFLSPVIILANWTTIKKASGVAALIILCNSITGLAGHLSSLNKVDSNILYYIPAVIAGSFIGSYLGTKLLTNKLIITCLFIVLFSAGLKFILVDFIK
ncbi:MAG: sulfite exporter TauE/SafE family protein [Sphingobacteriaceae bacterium]|nr:MAG: sulfite exporter TauE/SafE family protein [Sphingobacteriaceae bacterium]